MKISNKLLVALATTLATFTFTFPVHAEWRVGGQFGYVDSEAEAKGDLVGTDDDRSGDLDVFGQWRTASGNGTSFGVHFGYGQSGAEYESSDITLSDNSILKAKFEQGKTLDLLGVVAWNRDGPTPFVMFGYTTVEMESKVSVSDNNGTISDKDDVTLKGFKLVGGVEGEFSQGWVWHAALEYADYGDGTLTTMTTDPTASVKVEPDHTGIRFGIAYTF